MELANHARAASARKGAAVGFAAIAAKAGDALAPHLPKLAPKLFRMQFDPNKGVQEAAGAIWGALVADPRKALDAHFDVIVGDLIKARAGRKETGRKYI